MNTTTKQPPAARLALVVPCYNEAHRLKLEVWTTHLDRHPEDWMFFVDDGSSDETLAMLTAFAATHPRARVVHLAQNSGKAEAVRQGVLAALRDVRCEFVGYWDADLSASLELVNDFTAAFDATPEAVAAIGIRERSGDSEIHRSHLRHFTSWAFAQAASAVLGMRVRDTQCGAKMFRSTLAGVVFAQPFLTRWLFDIEVLSRLIHMLGKPRARRAILPVRLRAWHDAGESRFFHHYASQAPRDLLRIWWHYR